MLTVVVVVLVLVVAGIVVLGEGWCCYGVGVGDRCGLARALTSVYALLVLMLPLFSCCCYRALEDALLEVTHVEIPETLIIEQAREKFAIMMTEFKDQGQPDEQIQKMITKEVRNHQGPFFLLRFFFFFFRFLHFLFLLSSFLLMPLFLLLCFASIVFLVMS